MKQRATAGVGADVKKAKVIFESDENYLWEHDSMGNDNLEVLRNTLVWVLGLNFVLRAGQERRNLRMKNSQLSVAIDEDGKQYLEYKEDVSKDVSQVMKSTSFEGYYTNHSLQRTCATRLYDKGLPKRKKIKL